MNWQKLALTILFLWIVGLEPACARDLPEESEARPTKQSPFAHPGTKQQLESRRPANLPEQSQVTQETETMPSSEALDSAEVISLIDFEQETWDRNFDNFPDNWVRRKGPGFPAYIDIDIERFPGQDKRWGEGTLHIELDGGSAELSSPKIPIDPAYSIMLDGWAFLDPSKQNEVNEAWISLTLTSKDGKVRQTAQAMPFRAQKQWHQFKLGPIVPSDPQLTQLEVTLHFSSTRPEDLYGEAWFDNIRLTHLPKLNVKTPQPFNVFEKPEDVEVTVNVSGTKSNSSKLHLYLFDVENRLIDEHVVDHQPNLQAANPLGSLSTQPVVYPTERRLPDITGEEASIVAKNNNFPNEYSWSPKVETEGFYRLLVTLTSSGQTDLEREISMVVMSSLGNLNTSPFGWNIPKQPESVPLPNLVKLIRESGAHWLAYPIWFAEGDLDEAKRIGELAERLTLNGMDLVAVIDHPPAPLESQFGRFNQGIASLLHDADLWKPALDPVLTRLSFKIDWWQLGSFDDYSFVSHPDLDAKMVEVHDHLSRFGKNIKLGVTWNWLHQMELDPNGKLDYLLRTTPIQMTGKELLTYLKDQEDSSAPLWTTLQPLDQSRYSLSTRARDLVERMTMGKISGASAVLIPQPISTQSGLLNDDMTPTELLLPWRLTASRLAETQYMGQLDLPNDSENYVFRKGNDVTMLIWRDHPNQEVIDLGDNLHTQDCWGRDSSSFRSADEDTLDVTSVPQFVTGLNPNMVEWQMNCRFVDPHLDSVIGRKQQRTLEFKNTLSFGVSGTVTLTSKELWETPQVLPFKANPGETFSAAVDFALPSNINAGRHEVKVEFNLAGANENRLTLYRDLNVGIKGLRIDTATQFKGGQLLVHMTLINASTEEANLSLYLFAPNRRRQRLQVVRMKPGRVRRTFVVPNGAQLQDEMVWLRAEEIQGEQILNYRIPVEEPQAAQD